MVEVNRSGVAGSISLIVIGIILVIAALVFYFVKNVSFFAITVGIIGIITLILGLVIIFYAQSHELKRQKRKEAKVIGIPAKIERRDTPLPSPSCLMSKNPSWITALSVSNLDTKNLQKIPISE